MFLMLRWAVLEPRKYMRKADALIVSLTVWVSSGLALRPGSSNAHCVNGSRNRHALWAVTSLAEPRPQRFAVPPMSDPPHAMALLEPQHTLSGCLEVPSLLTPAALGACRRPHMFRESCTHCRECLTLPMSHPEAPLRASSHSLSHSTRSVHSQPKCTLAFTISPAD